MSRIQKVCQIIPPLSKEWHKGQMGRIAVIGGSADYTGAPYFSAKSASLLGADMPHIICTKDAALVIKTYAPDLMVHGYLRESIDSSDSVDDVLERVVPMFDRLHSIVVGPGLGRDELMMKSAYEIVLKAKDKGLNIVLDGDGLFLLSQKLDMITNYEKCVLTPNIVEFKRLCDKLEIEHTAKSLARKLGVTVIQKGQEDVIANAHDEIKCADEAGLKRCGGQGDLLSGLTGTFLIWKDLYLKKFWKNKVDMDDKEATLLACLGAATVTRYCSRMAYKDKGRSMVSNDMLEYVGKAYREYFEREESKI